MLYLPLFIAVAPAILAGRVLAYDDEDHGIHGARPGWILASNGTYIAADVVIAPKTTSTTTTPAPTLVNNEEGSERTAGTNPG